MIDPQNPYDSYMVEASAGTGKTYQLTQRFLFLVGAGADPASILAITFTVKAVQEMHSRIILEASKLLVEKDQQRAFEKKLETFFKEFSSQQKEGFKLVRPRTAVETAKVILSSTQRLKITTIDSIFYEWVLRFPSEANKNNGEERIFERSINLSESLDVETINKNAWEEIFSRPELREKFFSYYNKMKHLAPTKGLLSIQNQVEELFRYMLHIFYLEKKKGSAYLSYEEDIHNKFVQKTEKDLLFSLKEDLIAIALKVTKKEKILSAIEENSLEALLSSRILTQTFSVSKILVKGVKREALREEINRVESSLKGYYNEKIKKELKIIGENLFAIYQIWYESRLNLKKKMKSYEFSDLSMGCHNLFNNSENTSVLWLLQKSIHHILIDEFQDTSMVQWEVFSKILEEIMSAFEDSTNAEGYRTSFIVGDRKQSIYGFREADPYVMDLASFFFQQYKKQIVSLNKSYRTAPLLMDFVTKFFVEEIDKDFPVHETAKDSAGFPIVPNMSKIIISKLFEKSESEELSPLDQEAKNLAKFFSYVFSHPNEYLIFDKKNKCFRKIRYSDCCVLYRNATHVDTFIKYLEEEKIPYKKENESLFFEKQEIVAVLSLLRFFVDSSDVLSLLVFLRAGFLDIPENLIIELLDKTKEIDKNERAESLLIFLKEKGYDFDQIMALKDDSLFFSPHKILLGLYEKICFSQREEKKEEDKVKEKSLIKLLDLVLEIENRGAGTLQEVLLELDKLADHSVQGSDESSMESISLMTIHKSKGLEFPLVALIESADSWFKFDRYWLKSTEGVYYCGTSDKMPKEDKFFKKVYQETQKSMYEETIRLLYVALTRVSQYLFVSGHKVRSSQGKGFYSSLYSCLERSQGSKKKDNFCILESSVDKVEIKEDRIAIESEREESFLLSFSEAQELRIINPHSFLEQEDHDSSEKKQGKSKVSENLSALLGTFIHKAFEVFFSKEKLDLVKLWSIMIEKDSIYIRENLGKKFSQNLFDSTKEEIEKTLDSEKFKNLYKGALEVIPEMPVVGLHGSNLLIGSLDLFIRNSHDKITLVDYKTSECDKVLNLKNFCVEKNYHKQLFSYKSVLSKIYPKSKIKCCLWLSKAQEYVFF